MCRSGRYLVDSSSSTHTSQLEEMSHQNYRCNRFLFEMLHITARSACMHWYPRAIKTLDLLLLWKHMQTSSVSLPILNSQGNIDVSHCGQATKLGNPTIRAKVEDLCLWMCTHCHNSPVRPLTYQHKEQWMAATGALMMMIIIVIIKPSSQCQPVVSDCDAHCLLSRECLYVHMRQCITVGDCQSSPKGKKQLV